MKRLIITGGAGFIGSNLIDRLLLEGDYEIYCIDNFDPFYSLEIKRNNMVGFVNNPSVHFLEIDIRDRERLFNAFKGKEVDGIIHLAAKAGVRPSITNPIEYEEVNIIGTQNMLDLAKELNVEQFVFGSSSSVYGINPKTPWREDDAELQPISPYAATKLSGEFLGSIYTHLHNKRFIALRFFTVYGPRQRPDLAIHKFTKKLLNEEEIEQYGDGTTYRDYTFVDDIVSGIVGALNYKASMFEVINIGNNKPVSLKELIEELERATGASAKIKLLPEQPGDVRVTYADISKAQKLFGYRPETPLAEGLQSFVNWYRNNG